MLDDGSSLGCLLGEVVGGEVGSISLRLSALSAGCEEGASEGCEEGVSEDAEGRVDIIDSRISDGLDDEDNKPGPLGC